MPHLRFTKCDTWSLRQRRWRHWRAKGFSPQGPFHEKVFHETRCLMEQQRSRKKGIVSWKKGLVEKEGVEKRATWSLESFPRRYPIQRRFTLSPHQRVMPEVKLMAVTSTGTPRSKERGGQLEAAGFPSSCPLDSNHDGRRLLSVDGRPRDRYGLSRSSLFESPPAPRPKGASRHGRGSGCLSKMT